MKDLLVSLTDDHIVMSWLAHRLRTTTDGFSRGLLFNEFAKALGGHLSAMEYVVLPALARCGWRGFDSQVPAQHTVLKRRLADLLTLERGSSQFDADLNDLCDQVEAQAEREQRELLPLLRQDLDTSERAMLGSEVEARLGAFVGELREPGTEKPADAPTGEQLLEEAQLVLKSLPGSQLDAPAAKR
jgi:hypothetical protein